VVGDNELLPGWPVEDQAMTAFSPPYLNLKSGIVLAQSPENIIG
jgi:hypothetical protein